MPEEQIIYLDPNDELTRVREKIEEVPARRIIMVVPQQTQLRSNVGWRLLHARARELGKEVQVISPDRQVRAVAKAAGFRTSQPQEGSSTGRTRVPPPQRTQPQRGVTERRGIQRQRGPVNRGPVDGRTMRQREPLPPAPPLIEELPTETRPPQSTWRQQENAPANPPEPTSRQGKEEDYPPVEIIEDDAFDQPFEFGINEKQASTARPLIAHPDEEEHEDPYMQDYDTARRIREAAQEGTASNPPLNEQEPANVDAIDRVPTSHFSTPPEPFHANPFEGDVEEFSPSRLPEQHGPTFAPEVDDIAPDVTDIPTDVHKIEFLDDQDLPGNSQDFPARQWDNAFFNEPDIDVPAPTSDTRGRGARSGKLQRRLDEEDEDFLPPPPSDRPTSIRSNRPRPSGALNAPRAGSRSAPLPVPVEPPPSARNVNTRPVAQTQPRPVTRSRIPAAPPPRRQPRRASRGRGSRVATIIIVVLLLLLLVGIGFLYYGTTAKVTITVPSKTLSVNAIKLVASTKTQSKFPNSVASQVLTYNANVTGAGTATGTTKQGNTAASGIVNFTNNGQQLVTIPSNTQLTTNAGAGTIPFVTVANAVIPPTTSGNSPIPVPVQAQNPGNSGNVGANTITVVPATSITTIAQASNLSPAQINLSVTNPSALSGGGAAQVATVTQNDLQNLKNSLHSQLQTQVKNWLRGQLHQGDIAGTLSPDIVGSAQSLPEEQLTQVPAVGSPLPNKAFTGTLSTKVSVLVVRGNSLQDAAKSQLNAAALATKPRPYTISQLPITLSNVNSTASKDGSTIDITLSAKGQAMLQVNTQELSKYLTGKTVDQAHSDIASGNAGPTGVEDIKIEVSPSFLSLMPFRSEHIHIDVMPGI
ncbi:MAG TPA: baseplate J/gp47 family protein [Ktedonobacteraceae bacterium]|nr:baseplate J/gp47 family protein [Ktedonobacteraceae bacterium]